MRPQPVGQHRAVDPRGLDDEWIPQRRLGDLLLTCRSSHAVRRESASPVGRLRDLGMARYVVVGARHNANGVPVGVVGEALQVGDNSLRLGHVQLPVGVHEVVLGIDIPENDPAHLPSS